MVSEGSDTLKVSTNLEVSSERPVSQHLEESMMVGIFSYVVKIYRVKEGEEKLFQRWISQLQRIWS